MDEIKEIAAYCAAHIEDYEIRVHLAIKQMDRMRCPLSMADEGTFAEALGVDYDAPSYGDMACADQIVPDDVVFRQWEGVEFVEDDFD